MKIFIQTLFIIRLLSILHSIACKAKQLKAAVTNIRVAASIRQIDWNLLAGIYWQIEFQKQFNLTTTQIACV